MDPGAPGKGGGAEGFNAMSTHKIILNRNAENALRRNNHSWGTNMFLINNTRTQNLSGLRFFDDKNNNLLLDSFKSYHVGVTKYVRPKMDLTHRPHTTMIKIEDSNYRIMGSSHVGRVLQTKTYM